MWELYFKENAIKHLKKIDKTIQKRIKQKLVFFCSTPNPLFFAKRLSNSKLWEYRFRVGDYRIIFDIDENWKIIIIALIWKRGEIYE